MNDRISTLRELSFIQLIILLLSITFMTETINKERDFATLTELVAIHKIITDKEPLQRYKSLNAGLDEGDVQFSKLTISQIFLNALDGQFDKELASGKAYIFDIPVAAGHHIIIRFPETKISSASGSFTFYFVFLDNYTPVVERKALATTNVFGELAIDNGQTRYDITNIDDVIHQILLYQWKIVGSDIENGYLLAKLSLVNKTVTIPILQLSVQASNALICLAVLSIVLTGMSNSNLRELSAVKDFTDRSKPWIFLDSTISTQDPWFDRLSATLERIFSYLIYITLTATSLIVIAMYLTSQQIWATWSMFIAVILTLFSLIAASSSYYHLYKLFFHYRDWNRKYVKKNSKNA